MRKSIFAIAVCAILCGAFSACKTSQAGNEEASMVVATYNIRLGNNGDSIAGNGWGKRVPHIADVVKYHGFEIFGTQEGFQYMLNDLKAELPGYEYIGVGRDNGSDQGEHAAIFYDTDKFELLDHGDFWLSETPDSVSFGWDAVCRRICTWGKFLHKESNIPFVYFNLHMDHVGVVARAESAKLIFKKIQEFPEPLPVMLSGDFNIDQTNDGYKLLNESGIMKDSYDLADLAYITNSTYNAFNVNGTDLAADGTPARIDHIFLTPENFKVKKYGVLTDTYRDTDEEGNLIARTPSDHFPVRIEVALSRNTK